jgi:hypothetical protein
MLIPNDNERFFYLLKEAVLKNTVRPRPEEEAKMTISRLIRCSPEIEGDSQLGLVLFIGMAHTIYGISDSEIMDHLGIEQEEYKFKLKKFRNNLFEAKALNPIPLGTSFEVFSSREFDLRKLLNKVKLISNYVKFYSAKHSILFGSRGR